MVPTKIVTPMSQRFVSGEGFNQDIDLNKIILEINKKICNLDREIDDLGDESSHLSASKDFHRFKKIINQIRKHLRKIAMLEKLKAGMEVFKKV